MDSEMTQHMREVADRSRELLKPPPSPDTFLGRKTQEPFPREKSRYGITVEEVKE